jgi:hypothetical protein
MDPSLKPDPLRKGSYYRRIEDINRALLKLDTDRLPGAMQFMARYFACEKLARGIVGIHLRWPATRAYSHQTKLLLRQIDAGCRGLALPITPDDIIWIFADFNEQTLLPHTPAGGRSARVLRNTLIHDFGPTNVAHITESAQFHGRRMTAFLGCANQVLEYQRRSFSSIP